MKTCFVALALVLFANVAMAALAPSALDSVRISLPERASFPLALSASDDSGIRRTLGELLTAGPAFVLFADYTCKTLCGPALVLLSSALEGDKDVANSHIIVIGLDPKDTAEDARRMLAAQVPAALRSRTTLLMTDAVTVAAAAKAAGFHYVYDKAVDQFAHPEAVYAVDQSGRIVRLLSPFALTTSDLKSAFVRQDAPTFYDRVRLICYRFGVLSGPYSSAIATALKAAAALTILAFLGAIVFMQRKRTGA